MEEEVVEEAVEEQEDKHNSQSHKPKTFERQDLPHQYSMATEPKPTTGSKS